MQNDTKDWFEEVNFPVTICDKSGAIVYMNKESVRQFAKDGGLELMGRSLYDCHPEPARSMLADMLENQTPHTYISLSHGRRHLIHETPWYESGKFMGFVEISIDMDGLDPTT